MKVVITREIDSEEYHVRFLGEGQDATGIGGLTGEAAFTIAAIDAKNSEDWKKKVVALAELSQVR